MSTKAHKSEGDVPFMETWAYPSEVKKALGASWFEIEDPPVGGKTTFASGRPLKYIRFYGQGYGENRAVLAVRPAMELISKKTGEPYVVCRRAEQTA